MQSVSDCKTCGSKKKFWAVRRQNAAVFTPAGIVTRAKQILPKVGSSQLVSCTLSSLQFCHLKVDCLHDHRISRIATSNYERLGQAARLKGGIGQEARLPLKEENGAFGAVSAPS